MKFEYDSEKSLINQRKHGVDFEAAKGIWVQDNIIVPALTKDENRYMIIGMIGILVYSCIFTIRQDAIRIISCRRSREKEKELYYEKTQ